MSEPARAAASGAGDAGGERRPSRPKAERPGFFARIVLFWRQVVAELRKVVRPTRSELLNYTLVVLVFVAVVMAFVTVLDLAIGTSVGWIFGG